MKTKEDAEKLVHEDWKESRKVMVGEEKKEWRFQIDFRSRDIECIKLPVEYDLGAATFKEPVEATDITSFDDLVQYDPLEVLDNEVHKYETREIPAYFNYFPTEDTKPLRPGAESEYSIRGVRGDPELSDKKADTSTVAAMIGVLTRFGVEQYQASLLYRGIEGRAEPPSDEGRPMDPVAEPPRRSRKIRGGEGA